MNTLLLDIVDWDFLLDSAGNVAMAEEPYSQAQDAASYVKVFKGEPWYDTERGIPYFEEILGHLPSIPLFTEFVTSEALKVPGVVTAAFAATGFVDRRLSGDLVLRNTNNIQFKVGI